MGRLKHRHPFALVRAFMRRIPDRRLRGLAFFAMSFAISLIAGRLVESVLSKEALASAERAQTVWIAKLREFSPIELAKGYSADFGPASRGELIYKPATVVNGISTEDAAAMLKADADRHLACMEARAAAPDRLSCSGLLPAGQASSTCLVLPDAEGCAAYNACVEERGPVLSETPLECVGLGTGPLLAPWSGAGADQSITPPAPMPGDAAAMQKVVPAILMPFAALVRTVTRLFSGGLAAVVPIMQLGLGALLALAMMRDRRGFSDDSVFAMLIAGPIAVIALASLSAFALKWLMVGALAAFGWATGFADAAAGAGGFVGACWYCFAKLAEKGVEGAITGKVG